MDRIPGNITPTEILTPESSSDLSRSQSKSSGELSGVELSVVSPSHPGGLSETKHSEMFVSVSSPHQGIPLNSSRESLYSDGTNTTISRPETGSDFTPIIPGGENVSLKKTEEAKALLQEKIRKAQGIQFSSTVPFRTEREKSQQLYLKDLTKTLEAIQEVPFFDSKEKSDNIDEEISKTVHTILELSEAIQNEIEELYDAPMSERQEKEPSHNRYGIGNAREAIHHFIDYLHNLQGEDLEKTFENFCLALKCEATFKEMNALNEKEKERSYFYHQASITYEEARSAVATEAEEFHDLKEAAKMWMLAGETFNPNDANDPSPFYKKAAECFYGTAQKIRESQEIEGPLQELKGCQYLRNAAINFYRAGNIIKENNVISWVLNQLGIIQSHRAKAIIQNKRQADHYYEEAEKFINNIFDDDMSRDLQKIQLSLEAAYYADCVGEVLLNQNLSSINYQEAFDLQKQAINNHSKGKKEIAKSYRKAAEYSFKATKEKRKGARAMQLLSQGAERAYKMMAEEQEKESIDNVPIIKLFETAAKYYEIVLEEIEQHPGLDKATSNSLKQAAFNFLLAAETLQKEDHDLSEAYRKYAKSHYLLAVVRTPRLYQHLSVDEQSVLGNKEPVPNEGLIHFWEKLTDENFKILQNLQKERGITS